jgi:plastocyanin
MTPDRLARPVLAAATLAIAGLFAGAIAVVADSPAPGSPAASGAAAGSGGPAASGANEIQIIQKTFQPANLTIHVGDTVTWTVTQAIADPHSVTSGNYKDQSTWTTFDSGIKLKNNGDSFKFTFTTAGTYPYFCQVHPDTMSGVITVEDVNGSAGGGESGGIPVENKLIAGGILIAALVVFFGWAALYRRMNPEA